MSFLGQVNLRGSDFRSGVTGKAKANGDSCVLRDQKCNEYWKGWYTKKTLLIEMSCDWWL